MRKCAVAGWLCMAGASAGLAQTASSDSSNLSPDLREIVKLSQAHQSDDVIIGFIRTSGKTYRLGADELISLSSLGVSQSVIRTLQAVAVAGSNPGQPPTALPDPEPQPPPVSQAEPPATAQPIPVVYSQPATFAPAGLQDNFYTDAGLNPAVWQTQSDLLTSLGAMSGSHIFPALAFSPAGMQMAGTSGAGQFTGIQSTASFVAPFTFSARVSGLSQNATPFEIYLVSPDLRQWVSIAGHLGGLGGHGGRIRVGGGFGPFGGDVRIGGGGNSPDYGVWLNSTGSGLPISALGTKIFENPIAGVPYTIQVVAGADGMAGISLLNSEGAVLAARNVPLGTGPFSVVLAAHNGPTAANWQSVQVAPAAPALVEQPLVPAAPTLDYFQAQLAPYGSWITVPGYGYCWQPQVESGWRPYLNQGHWEFSDAGWYWQSDYSWGDLAFHYGRWAYTSSGWIWVPGFDYAPAWVVWRHADADGFVGWAPLPPGAVFVDGGWEFNRVRVGFDFDFGLRVNFFTFIGYDHFWEHDFRGYVLARDRMDVIYRRSLIESHYHLDHGRFIHDGLARERMAALTHREIRAEAVHNLREREEHRNAELRHDDIRGFHPGDRPNADRIAGTRDDHRGETDHREPDRNLTQNHDPRSFEKPQPGAGITDKHAPGYNPGNSKNPPGLAQNSNKGQAPSKSQPQGNSKSEGNNNSK